jgi:alpha-galactosidase
MSIIYEASTGIFHLKFKDTSYIFQVTDHGYLSHLYWGKKIQSSNLSYLARNVHRGFTATPDSNDKSFSLDTLRQEYPSFGTSDFRHPAYQVQLENGSTISNLRCDSFRIKQGKPSLPGLPATYVESNDEADTLEVILLDKQIGLKVILSYTVFNNLNALTRSVRFVNEGSEAIKLLKASSASIDFARSDYEFIHLSGAHERERYIEKRRLVVGNQSVESRRGASSHQHNPFIALTSKNATEDYGDVFGFNIVYSGNFLAEVEVDHFKTTRVTMGINPFDFSWLLEQGEDFQTPEVVMVYSSTGFGEMSRTYHELYRTRLCRGFYRDKPRPILVNNWEATYFKFNEQKILEIMEEANELGIELFVLDDGWFGKRNNAKSSLGDWVVNKEKLPNGIDGIAKKANELNLQFGLWFEPEMVSPDSNLYRQHPDWCLHVPERHRTESRNQLILDFSRKDVCDAIIVMVSEILASAPISYVKWDMNRHMTEVGSARLQPKRQRETAHRYMLGLYRVMEEITSAFPNILFESCSGGGGRYDPGMLYYMPQVWTSDNTDAVSRLKIQYGTSLVYPIITMGAHVSAAPNHQTRRNTSLKMRGDVAMSGNLGYELDLTKFTEDEKEIVKKQVQDYKEIRELVQFGNFYRLLNPFKGNEAAWMFLSKDKKEVFIGYYRILGETNMPLRTLPLKGLPPKFKYRDLEKDDIYYGDELLHAGLNLPLVKGDYISCTWRLIAEE